MWILFLQSYFVKKNIFRQHRFKYNITENGALITYYQNQNLTFNELESGHLKESDVLILPNLPLMVFYLAFNIL